MVVLHDHYASSVEMESLILVDMLNRYNISLLEKAGVGGLATLKAAVGTINVAMTEIHMAYSFYDKEKLTRVLILEIMVDSRVVVND